MDGQLATEMPQQPQKFSVYVGNIPYSASENDIGRYFSTVGNVINVRFVYDRETRRPKGFGFCDFSDQGGAQAAVQNLNGADFNGRALRVNYANK
uniref:RRM domain-containing protein n=1 Tax=Parastrongyloides trichosuri TaxID=131310 RepID=A0A0N5A4W8_PARTI